ncbi:MAG: glycosyltransferase family 2 protein [Candidatus Andersenbacteria bacterium]|nr:glycosyltransferase family 2 protein [bacterium]MDZ4225804.1 glycosyltransferase family 2 protein [Candidatus Andersenbacteria bacterium]
MSQVNIVIVNWNTGGLLAKCLRSLVDSGDRDLINKIFVADNASSDNSLAQAKRVSGEMNNVAWMELSGNLGFAKANNLALAKSGFNNHVLLLNPDTQVAPGAIRALLKTFDEDKKAGVVGARLLNTDGSIQPSVRLLPTGKILAGLMLKLNRLRPKAKMWREYLAEDFDYRKQQEVEQVMGAVFLINKELLRQIGGLDECFWIWFEEVDYCFNARKRGWRIVYRPDAPVVHFGGASLNQLVGIKKSWLWAIASIKYASKNLRGFSAVLLILLLPISLVLSIPAGLHHRQLRANTKEKI